MMSLPEDWDKPSPENESLCKRFDYGRYEGDGITMPYRFFVPLITGRKLPFVIYLHGADAVGDDNEQHLGIHDIGTMFARDDWQEKEPCYILAPQYGRGQHWSTPAVGKAVMHLIKDKVASCGTIDTERIYIYGYSAGGVGTLRLVKENPGYFAGAVSICGATGQSDIEKLCETPLWMIHAADDLIVKTDFRDGRSWTPSHYGSRNIYDEFHEKANRMYYTEFPAGWMSEKYGVNPHCSWVVMSDPKYPEYSKWLFSQKNSV